MGDKINKGRTAIFIASLISLGVGFGMIGLEYISYEKQKVNIENYVFDVFTNEKIFSFTGEILIENYFSDRPKTDIKLFVKTNIPSTNSVEVFIIPEDYTSINSSLVNKFKEHFSDRIISLTFIGSGNYEGLQQDLLLNISNNHHFAILIFDENNDFEDYVISTQSISLPSQLEIKQHQSALDSIHSSKIIEGLTWAILGVSGMVFLAQIGLSKNE